MKAIHFLHLINFFIDLCAHLCFIDFFFVSCVVFVSSESFFSWFLLWSLCLMSEALLQIPGDCWPSFHNYERADSKLCVRRQTLNVESHF